MKHLVTFALGVTLLVALVMTKATLHGPIAAACFAVAWALDREVARGLGRPRTWAFTMFVLVALGAWLGPKDSVVASRHVSFAGALAGITMASRAVGLLLATTAITRSVSPEKLLARVGRGRGRALAASVVVALRIAPELAARIRGFAAEARTKHPGLLRAPSRAFEVLVLGVVHATQLADDVARELASHETR